MTANSCAHGCSVVAALLQCVVYSAGRAGGMVTGEGAGETTNGVSVTFGSITSKPPSHDGFIGYTMDYWNASAGDNWLDTSSVLSFSLNDTVPLSTFLYTNIIPEYKYICIILHYL